MIMHIGDFEPIFGKNVRYLRSLCHMSQGTLALLIGTSAYSVRKIENAKGLIGMDYRIFFRLCRIFHLSADVIFRQDLEEQGFTLPVFADLCREAVEEYFFEFEDDDELK